MNRHSLISRWLHALLALGITLQLLLSLAMQRPRAGRAVDALAGTAFEVHETLGLILLPLCLAWFVWVFVRAGESGPGQLFPWFSADRRRAFLGAAREGLGAARRGRLPDEPTTRILAPAIHGLGALCALYMAGSGALVWLGMSEQGQLTAWARPILETHQAVANLMWAYLVGHGLMAILHERAGEASIRRMFVLVPSEGE